VRRAAVLQLQRRRERLAPGALQHNHRVLHAVRGSVGGRVRHRGGAQVDSIHAWLLLLLLLLLPLLLLPLLLLLLPLLLLPLLLLPLLLLLSCSQCWANQ
jgi:hypothetical protein